ncbi:NADH:flavin oxidoreductase/NADH oxidase [Shouchella sp. 1P09AA]|uniref:NADH:flavin oxidoreductase/NADH oxidase n=1 Tax=unclassified Shouchella TaxID=2893065 RepID=UPI0039A34E0F
MNHLMSSYKIGNLELKNRIVMSPMCQYSAVKKDGMPTDWHLHHYTTRAVGGVGLIIVEMTNIEEDGRISDFCLGLWSDAHRDAFKPIVDQAHKHGAKIGIQIAHAGRKAEDTDSPISASPIAYDETFKKPYEASESDIKRLVIGYQDAARRAVEAGFDVIELHGAHGYLIHQFLSPYTNQRQDRYGEERTLFAVEVIKAMKAVMPTDMPLIMRISAMEYVEEGYELTDAVAFSRTLKEAGVDLFDVSSGGEGKPSSTRFQKPYAGYQVPFARKIRQEIGVPVMAVGMLENPEIANAAIRSNDADLVAIGRGLLSHPYWTFSAATQLNLDMHVPKQYEQATF